MRRVPASPTLALLLAVAIHADWHLGRTAHHRMSFGLPYHWLFAIPVFAVAAWYVERRWPERVAAASALNLALAIVAAQLLEPLGEQLVYFHRFALDVPPARWAAFLAFTATGVAAYALAIVPIRARAVRPPPPRTAAG